MSLLARAYRVWFLGLLLGILLQVVMPADPVEASGVWTQEDVSYQLLYSTLHVLDWKQTRSIARHPQSFYETNPILGTYPSVKAVDTYFLATAIGHILVAHFLPPDQRRIWQRTWIGIERNYVDSNLKIGITVSF
jgi:hypothetical protein